MLTVNATDVRKDWGEFIDSIVREKPKVIKRSRDYIVAMSLPMLREILNLEKMKIIVMQEDDGSFSAVIDELDLTAHAETEEQVVAILADAAIEYANDYYNEFSYWYTAPNRKKHLPYVLAILAREPQDVVKELFVCRVGKN